MGVKVREKPPGSGVFWIFIDHQGKRKAKKIGRDKRLANEVAKKIEAKLTLGDLDLQAKKQETMSFKDFSTLWLEDYIKPLRRQSTYERYRDMLTRHVYPSLGDRPIDQIKRKEIRNLILMKNKKGLSRSMLCLIRDVISGPMGYAVDEELIEANPVSGILKRLKLERNKKITIEPMTQEEVELFLETCQTYWPEHFTFFLCAFRTGMRLGEILALQWSDIDFNSDFIRVERSYKRGIVELPKNGKTRRVDMSDQLTFHLKGLFKKSKKEGLKAGKGGAIETIFHRNSEYMEQNYIRRIFKRVLEKAGIRNMRLHDTRHTFASLLLSNGESPVYVKEQLGHSSIQITVDIYGHLIPSSNRKAVNRLDNSQQSATYTQPAKTEKPQPLKIVANSL
ncbi:MAG: site-specific integrase [Desulfobacterales bacterium]|nr:site-specific integrase [Desulfobacterales bacterium]